MNHLSVRLTLPEIVSNIGAIVFDWNGTVVDDLPRATVATNETLVRFGLPRIDRATFQERFRLPLETFFIGLGIDATDCASAIACWNRELSERETHLQPGILDVIERSRKRGLLVGVVSAASDTAIEADLRAHAIGDEIAFAFGSVRDKTAALRAIAASISGALVYVGDTEYDMEAAETAGVIGLAYTRGYRPGSALAAAGATALIDDYGTLSEVIAAWPR